MKILIRLLLFTFLFLFDQTLKASDSTEVIKEKLHLLLEKRKDDFGNYLISLESKTGFFGNQTKKDIKRSNEVLENIVRTDNGIFIELKKLLDARTSEKTDGTFELANKESKIQRQETALVNVQSTIENKNKEIKVLEKSIKSKNISLIVLLLLFLASLFYLIKQFTRLQKQKSTNEKNA